MKKFKSLPVVISMIMATLISGIFMSCTKDENYIETPPTITVHLYIVDSVNVSRYVVKQKSRATRAFLMTRAASGSSTATNFAPEAMPTNFTAYFVAASNEDGYTAGALIKIIKVTAGDNSITLPNIAYHIYVTNYTSTNTLTENNTNKVERAVTGIRNSFPTGTTTLYLWGELTNSTTFSNGTVKVDMKNPYAAIAILKNNFVTGATYNGFNNAAGGSGTYATDDKFWYYLYIEPQIGPNNKETGTNTAVSLQNIAGGKKSFNLFDNSIIADYIYQYTITDNKSGCGLNINVDSFKGTYSYTLNGGDDNGTYTNPATTN